MVLQHRVPHAFDEKGVVAGAVCVFSSGTEDVAHVNILQTHPESDIPGLHEQVHRCRRKIPDLEHREKAAEMQRSLFSRFANIQRHIFRIMSMSSFSVGITRFVTSSHTPRSFMRTIPSSTGLRDASQRSR